MSEQRMKIYGAHSLFVSARRADDGSLVIYGQDLTGREYEYGITVSPADVPRVVEALGGAPADDPLPLLANRGEAIVQRGELKWLKDDLGLTVKFWSRAD